MSENNVVLYGDSSTVKVSFAYGTIAQAAADDYPGGVAFGYDAETNAGAIYRMGKLVTSRILDIILSDTTTDNVKLVTVKYVDTDGLVQSHTFNAVDESLITSLKSRIETLENNSSTGGHEYKAGEYIDVSTDYTISVKYSDLYTKVKTDLIDEGVITPETAHTIVEEGDYITVDTSLNKAKVGVKYTELYDKVKSDLASAGIGDTSTINTEQNARILAIENGYIYDASVTEEENSIKKSIEISKKSRTSEAATFDETKISFDVPTKKYYDNIDSSINSVESRVSALEAGGGSSKSIEWLDVSTLLVSEDA